MWSSHRADGSNPRRGPERYNIPECVHAPRQPACPSRLSQAAPRKREQRVTKEREPRATAASSPFSPLAGSCPREPRASAPHGVKQIPERADRSAGVNGYASCSTAAEMVARRHPARGTTPGSPHGRRGSPRTLRRTVDGQVRVHPGAEPTHRDRYRSSTKRGSCQTGTWRAPGTTSSHKSRDATDQTLLIGATGSRLGGGRQCCRLAAARPGTNS